MKSVAHLLKRDPSTISYWRIEPLFLNIVICFAILLSVFLISTWLAMWLKRATK